MQNHIYELGLLHGQCSDIRIRAFGRIYHFHRLLLIQSGFFRAMLCGGYAEDLAVSYAATQARKRRGSADHSTKNHASADADIIELRFDDPNISRAAFEYCIARLYGRGPRLVLPVWSSPYDMNSLTVDALSSLDSINKQRSADDCDAHAATPRFLLSLLATSIYLNIPSITSQALTLVLCSVTPFTVVHYLRFAIGKGIDGTDPNRLTPEKEHHSSSEWDWELEGPVRTLEQLARPYSLPISYPPDSTSQVSSNASTSASQKIHRKRSTFDELHSEFCTKVDISDGDVKASSKHPRSRTAMESGPRQDRLNDASKDCSLSGEESFTYAQATSGLLSRDDAKTAGPKEPSHDYLRAEGESGFPEYHYGSAADKIGEACVCWYAQNGYDGYFSLENSLESDRVNEIENWIWLAREEKRLDKLSILRARVSMGNVDLLQTSSPQRGLLPKPDESLTRPRLKVWAYPSLPSSWVRSIISSDSFFVHTEWERYEFAKRIVDFRRKQKKVTKAFDTLIENCMEELTLQRQENAHVSNADHTKASQTSMSDDGHAFGIKTFRRGSTASNESDGSSDSLPDSWIDESCTSQTSIDEDEAEYDELFTSGIYYSHMSFQELSRISRDCSPITGRPYAPLHVLQAALWVSNELRNKVLSRLDFDQDPSNFASGETEASDAHQYPPVSSDDDPEVDAHGALGVSSALLDFQQAFESHISASNFTQRSTRSKSSTPLKMPENASQTGKQPSSGLGGIAENPLLLEDSIGISGLLKKRYYLVTSDDTVRFGDGLMSLMGTNPPSNPAGSTTRRAFDDTLPGMSDDEIFDDLGPTGYAIAQMAHTVPIETLINRELGFSSNPKKHRDHYYGIANDVATGLKLGKSAYRASRIDSVGNSQLSPPTPSHSPSFSLQNSNCEKSDDPGESGDGDSAMLTPSLSERWSAFEPMRIGVEFFGIDKLQEKQRLYSPTFFYAGSIWNLYIQLVRKTKGVQLGIYLHRQSPNESLPAPSAPTANEGDVIPASTVSTNAPNQRRRADFISPSTPRRAAQTEQTEVDLDARASGGDSSLQRRAGGRRPQSAATHDSGRNEREANGSSFFDTSLTGESPLRAGGGRHMQAGPSTLNDGGVGSSISLPGDRLITALMSPNTSSLFNRDLETNAMNAPYSSSSDDATQTLPPSSTSAPPFSGLASNFLRGGPSLADTTDAAIGSDPQLQPTVPLFPGGPSVLKSYPAPKIPYKDPRKELRAYFSIHCPSPLGNALTKFSSGPDKFTNSQSWGWKSSSLLGAVYLEDGDLEQGGKSGFWPRFRCVCTIGLV